MEGWGQTLTIILAVGAMLFGVARRLGERMDRLEERVRRLEDYLLGRVEIGDR